MRLPLITGPESALAAARGREPTAPATWLVDPPAGARRLHRILALDDGAFETVRQALWRWEVHRGAGLRPLADGPPQVGTTVVLTAGPGRLSVQAPCRVVAVADEADRASFTYATLPGHPERGVERFKVVRDGGSTRFEIDAVSQEAWWAARIVSPLARLVQDRLTEAYLRAATRGTT